MVLSSETITTGSDQAHDDSIFQITLGKGLTSAQEAVLRAFPLWLQALAMPWRQWAHLTCNSALCTLLEVLFLSVQFTLFGSQAGIYYWKKRHKRSYELVLLTQTTTSEVLSSWMVIHAHLLGFHYPFTYWHWQLISWFKDASWSIEDTFVKQKLFLHAMLCKWHLEKDAWIGSQIATCNIILSNVLSGIASACDSWERRRSWL